MTNNASRTWNADTNRPRKDLNTLFSGLKNITYPVCLNEDNKHNFDVIQKHLDTLKEVHGPIYVNDNAKHSFSEIQKAAEQIQSLNHPVLNTGDAKNHFNQMVSAAEKLKNMNGKSYFYFFVFNTCFCQVLFI